MNWKEIIYLDLFSGVGGFSYGFQQAGIKFKKHYFSEIDKHSIAVYKHKFKKAENVGNIELIPRGRFKDNPPNIITFGFPCQDLSIAGWGAGLDGARSGLFFEAIRLIKEYRPEVFVFENVKGLLSSNERKDFEIVLRTIADLGLYECEWQLVNTSWVLPQNRERIYFIGHLRGRSEPRVFPFREGDSEFNSEQGCDVESEIASCLQSPGNACGNYKGMNVVVNFQGNDIANTIRAGGGGSKTKKHNWDMVHISSNTKKGYEEDSDGDSVNFSIPNSKTRRGRVGKGKAQTIDTQVNQGVVVNINIIGINPEYIRRVKDKRNGYLQWDTSGKGYNSQHDRAYYCGGDMGCIPSTRAESKVNIISGTAIRRLTPVECERLQGLPDNWTEYGNYDGEIKKVSKTQRYKQMGNAITTIWAKLIGQRLINN